MTHIEHFVLVKVDQFSGQAATRLIHPIADKVYSRKLRGHEKSRGWCAPALFISGTLLEATNLPGALLWLLR